MNSTFKVVFNKARGTLMVANELTSSVQKKGVSLVAATAAVLTFLTVPSRGWGGKPLFASLDQGQVVQKHLSSSACASEYF